MTTGAPLSGFKVLDLSSVLMGPYCTRLLADLGAEVIKLEDPAAGDGTRHLTEGRRPAMSGTFVQLHHGKQGIALDLKDPEGREACLRLAAGADVFVHSIRPGPLERLGLGYEAVAGRNPDIVYCNLLGFGRGGRYFNQPAYDDTVQALSGLAMLQTEYQGEPGYVPSAIADKVAGLSAALAIVAALLQRREDGRGQQIDVPMFETMASFLLLEHQSGAVFDPPLGPPRYERLLARDRRPFRTSDGLIAAMVYNDKHWFRFCVIAGQPGLREDPRFVSFAARSRNAVAYYALLSDLFAERNTADWEAALLAAEIPCTRVNSLADLFDDPHLHDVGFFVEADASGDGAVRLARPAIRLRGMAGVEGEPSAWRTPLLGEDSRAVLAAAGYSVAEIDELAARGVLRDGSPRAAPASRQQPNPEGVPVHD